MAEYDIAVRLGDERTAGQFTAMAAELARGADSRQFLLVSGPAVRLTDLTKLGLTEPGDVDPAVIVWTNHVTPMTADGFRRSGVQFADEAGNAWIEFGNVLIDIRGRRPAAPTRRARPSEGGNIFSTGRSQVVFSLLAWPQLWEATTREVAAAAGVSVGLAHNALTLLRSAGYEPSGRLGAAALLDNWAATFPTGLARKLELARYYGDATAIRTVDDDASISVSGEAAARETLRPTAGTLYVDELDHMLPIVNRWRADGDGEPNIVVRRRFWTPPTPDEPLGTTVAPWPLVYADLASSEDPRVRHVARDWRERFVQSGRR
jgi:hypothetical protein